MNFLDDAILFPTDDMLLAQFHVFAPSPAFVVVGFNLFNADFIFSSAEFNAGECDLTM